MDFGKLSDISHVDFTLPPSHPRTLQLLQQSGNYEKPRVHVGLPVWVNKAWVGKYYPVRMPEKESLLWYGKQFNTIELNSTHYHIPSPDTIDRWRHMVPHHFRFSPKFPQLISHEAALRSTQDVTAAFCASIAGLEERLGTSFLQLPPTFGPRQLSDLEAFVRFVPETIPFAIELRHPDWYADKVASQELFDVLEKHRVGTVLTDVAGRRDMLHMQLATPAAMVRFVGNGLHPTDYTRIDSWVVRLQEWFDHGLQELYFFVHEPDNTQAPELATYLIEQLNKVCGFDLKPPKKFVQPVQGELF
ncbi:uncharacterized protein YecE (DUF72 family) [Pontibacter ummariensis]|uniref:Uncharacterized conserved protein YecE, DUF72 family n=1 Tax=Pontibacter ummariensis TaxID=1610492 RepID=A0A239CSR3_9BACT|nr:DUF72 domain-containing protein [Pontibacter ummariensis]PRY14881.1 uncharacterized protein YecE (DUF72 family) [Pontibacter ummariensis]SNS22423.1 Uncharacterized conserved protein YecE, DUF72 family [Pontibacter ummariensis]